jgi:hypothetical protein
MRLLRKLSGRGGARFVYFWGGMLVKIELLLALLCVSIDVFDFGNRKAAAGAPCAAVFLFSVGRKIWPNY